MKKITALLLVVTLNLFQLTGVFADTVPKEVKENPQIQSPQNIAEVDGMAVEGTYTNRFIVKYKDGKEKKTDQLEKAIGNAFNHAKTRKEQKRLEYENKRKEKSDNLEFKQNTYLEKSNLGKPDIQLKSISVNDTNYNIISLNDTIEPNEFMDSVRAEVGREIQYIQPDYQLDLSDAAGTITVNLEEKTESNNIASKESVNKDKIVDDGTISKNNENTEKEETATQEIDKEKITEKSAVVKDTEKETVSNDIYDDHDINHNLELAWQRSTGKGVIIAIIDTGIDVTHPALSSNMIRGWDFYNNKAEVYNPELGMEQVHGTHIAGIIKKVAPDVQIMPLKVFENGVGYTSDIISAIQYAEANGAKIVNCSWGSTDNNLALREVMEQSGMTFICAAGNNRLNVDQMPIYPASFGLDNTVSVTAFNNDFGLSYFSNYGNQSVDIAAWGRDVYSTFPNGGYGTMSGTSMSAGYISGAAALVAAQGVMEVKQQLKSTSDRLSCLQTKVEGGNKINFNNAVNSIINNTVISITPEDDFDAQGYQPTPEESWELFCGLENVQVAGGDSYSIAVKNNGTVWAWGYNNYGQLGDGTYTTRTTPVQVTGLTGITQVAAGASHSIALRNDGTVWAWGDNYYGQLGNGTTTARTTPLQVPGLTGIMRVSGGANHSIAVKNDGTVWAWGNNSYGQVGDGTTIKRTAPVQVLGLTGITQVAGGVNHSIALKNDGMVWAWGYNYNGQLGDGTTTNRSVPVQVLGLTGITQVAGGASHSIALKNDGTVWAWGFNYSGQLGNGTTTTRTTPFQVAGLTGITRVAGGANHSMAVKNDGTVWAWGSNDYGQLGDGTTIKRTTPVQVLGLTGIMQVAGGEYHSLVIKTDGMIWAWGYNYDGELGDGTTLKRTTPVHVLGLTEITQVAGGDRCSIAVRNDGTVWAWGENYNGQLGDGTTTDRSTPVQVTGLTGITQVAGGASHSLAIKNDGTVWAWGGNYEGQLGNETATTKGIPVQVTGLTGITQVAAGNDHSLALKNDGTVWAWGENYSGQLGDGTTISRSTPVQVSGLTGIIQIARGYYHSLALKNDGTVWAWGENSNGQIGDGTTENRITPVQIPGLIGITQVAGGYFHSIAIKNDGTIWAWGFNYYGQLGDGTTTNRVVPVQVSGLTGVIQVTGGHSNSIGVKNDGTVWTWGNNSSGQLGDGTTTNRSVPIQVSGLTGILQAAEGLYHSIVLKNDGTVWTCGNNYDGQLGDGRYLCRENPYCIEGKFNDVHGDNFSDAHETNDYGVTGGLIDDAGDNDYFRFTATESGSYTICTTSSIDTYGYLYGPNPSSTSDSLTYNDDAGYATNFKITYNLVAGTSYYVRVRHYYSTGTGAYKLVIYKPLNNITVTDNSNNESIISLSAQNVTDTNALAYRIVYNPNQIELVDLNIDTDQKETSVGTYGNLNVFDMISGEIDLIVNNINVPTNGTWRGTLNSLKFKFKPTYSGTTSISY